MSPNSAKASSSPESTLSTGGVVPSTSESSSSALIRASVERSRCSAAATSRLGDEPVADSTYRLDPAWLFQSPADFVHRLLDAVLKPGIAAAPHAFENLGASYHFSRAAGEHLQHQQGPALELQRPLTEPGLPSGGIDPQSPSHQDTIGVPPLPQRSAHPRQEHLPVSALDDVIRSAALDSYHLVACRVPRPGEDDHGEVDSVAAGPELVEHLRSLHVRHLVVEQHQVRRADPDARQRFGPADGEVPQAPRPPKQLGSELGRARLWVHG